MPLDRANASDLWFAPAPLRSACRTGALSHRRLNAAVGRTPAAPVGSPPASVPGAALGWGSPSSFTGCPSSAEIELAGLCTRPHPRLGRRTFGSHALPVGSDVLRTSQSPMGRREAVRGPFATALRRSRRLRIGESFLASVIQKPIALRCSSGTTGRLVALSGMGARLLGRGSFFVGGRAANEKPRRHSCREPGLSCCPVPILRWLARSAMSSEEFVTQCAPPFGEHVVPLTMIKSIEFRSDQS